MTVLPRRNNALISFCEIHLDPWVTNQVSIGITAQQAADITSTTQAARIAFMAALAARDQARVATEAMNRAIANMREEASNIIKTVRTFAESTHDPAVFALALIPSPAPGSALPAPPTPTHLTGGLNNNGFIELKWKAPIRGRMFFTIERQLTPAPGNGVSGVPGVWENRGAVPGAEFMDTAIPPGTVSANYRIATQRGRNRSVFTDPISVLLATPGTPAVSGQAAA